MADLVVTATSVVNTAAANVASGVAGETITAGQAVYVKASDGKVYKAKCSGTAAEADAKGVALNGGAINQAITYATDGEINIGATTVKTTTYMLSATYGGVAPQADLVSTNSVVRLGYAKDTAGAFVVSIKNTGVVV